MFSSIVVASPEYFCPAKLNLSLAVTGRRADGFHELVSLVAPIELGDTLRVEAAAEFSLACDDPSVPADRTNLVWRAAEAFQAATGWRGGARFTLTKGIPAGAGLGGGSSDAATALRALNELAGAPLAPAALSAVAAQVGSDCPLFLAGGPVIMRGRGEQLEPVSAPVAERLRGRRVLVFKPAFGIATPWAYGRLARTAPSSYVTPVEAEARLEAVCEAIQAGRGFETLLANSLEQPTFAKFVALPTLLTQLRRQCGLAPRMSGSGSACFAFVDEAASAAELTGVIRAAWGDSAFIADTRLR